MVDVDLVNGLACLFWSVAFVASIRWKKTPYNIGFDRASTRWIERSDTPRLFWSLTALMGLLAIWTGTLFVLHGM